MLKTIGDFLEARYQQSHVLAVCGLKAMTLQNWNARGLGARPPSERPGTGNRRTYSALDVLLLTLMKELTGLKVPVSFAHELATDIAAPIVENSKSLNDPARVPVDTVCILIPTSKENRSDLKWYPAGDRLPVIETPSNPWPSGYIILPTSKIVSRVSRALTLLVRPSELTENPDQHLEAGANQTGEMSREPFAEIHQSERYGAVRRAVEKSRLNWE